MAAFNPRLATVNSPASPIDPGSRGPSPFASALGAAGDIFDIVDGNNRRNASGSGGSGSSDSAADEGVEDQIALAEMRARAGRARELRTSQAPTDQILPREVLGQISRIEGAQNAYDQGILGIDAFQLQFENEIMRIFADNPDSASDALDYLETAGVRTTAFRDLIAHDATVESQEEAQRSRENEAAAYYYANNPNGQNVSASQAAHLGAVQRAVANEEERLYTQATRAQELNTRERAELNRGAFDTARIRMESTLTPITTTLLSNFQASAGDFESFQQLRTLVPEAATMVRQEVQAIIDKLPPGVSAETIANIRTQGDEYIEALEATFGNSDVQSMLTQLIEADQAQADLMLREAMPAIARIRAISPDILAPVLENTLQAVAAGEISNDLEAFVRDGFGTPAGRAGSRDLQEVADNTAATVSSELLEMYPGIWRGRLLAARKAGVDPATPPEQVPEVVSEFAEQYEGMVSVALSDDLIPGQVQPGTLRNVVETLFDPAGTRDMLAMAEEHASAATTVQWAHRQAATVLDRAQSVTFDPRLSGQQVIFNEQTGRYEVTMSEVGFRAGNLARRVGLPPMRSTGRVPREMQEYVDSQNRLLDFLVETAPYEDSLDPGASAREIRNAYAMDRLELVQAEAEVAPTATISTPPPETGRGLAPELAGSGEAPQTPAVAATLRDPVLQRAIEHEGDIQTRGYIPTSGSGMTVGAGIDLGQWTADELTGLGLSPRLISVVEPWLGLTTQEAVDSANLGDLQLSQEDAEEISAVVLENSRRRAASVPAYDNLSSEGQAMLVSMRHWAGQLLASNNRKLRGDDGTNALAPVLSDENATDADLSEALAEIARNHPEGTAARNRVERMRAELQTR